LQGVGGVVPLARSFLLTFLARLPLTLLPMFSFSMQTVGLDDNWQLVRSRFTVRWRNITRNIKLELCLSLSTIPHTFFFLQCGSYGPDKTTYHDVNGNPVVNTARFPDLKNMTDYAHSLGLKAGWYGVSGLFGVTLLASTPLLLLSLPPTPTPMHHSEQLHLLRPWQRQEVLRGGCKRAHAVRL
jgi:hypothetical protein